VPSYSFLFYQILAQVFRFLVLEKPPCFGKQDLGWIRATHDCRTGVKSACHCGLESRVADLEVTDIIDIYWVELLSCCTNVTVMQAIVLGTSRLVSVRAPWRALTTRKLTDAVCGKEGKKRKRDNRVGAPIFSESEAWH